MTTHRSLTEKIEYFAGNFDMLIVDECDRNLTDNMYEALNLIDVDFLYWFTWTPKTKELSLESMQLLFWKHIKVDVNNNNWYQILPDIRTFKYRNGMEYPYTQWHELKEMLVNDWIRFSFQCNLIKKCFINKYLTFWLLLVERKEDECVQYFEWFKANTDIPTIMINGDTKIEDDNKWIDELKEKWYWLVIWTVWKVWRWADIPMIDWVFLFFPNRFESSTVQAVGRWLRSYLWKAKCILFDWSDDPILRSQLYERKKTYKKEYWFVKTNEYIIDATKYYQNMSSQTL